ncbi:hypothetical protein WAF17_16885 [Bernardetia sp. ABR2-2B]|uniref:hypothetical protein n=1 Tax=Bernardetia sp. ABR2-2B TaxID=3127472 RepID=UPI0030CB76FA
MNINDLNDIVQKLYDKYSEFQFTQQLQSFGELYGWDDLDEIIAKANQDRSNKTTFIKSVVLSLHKKGELQSFLTESLEPTFSISDFKSVCLHMYDYLSQLEDIPLFFQQATSQNETYGGSREAVYRNAVLAHLKAIYKQSSGLVTAESLQKGGKVDISIQLENNEKLLIAEFKIRSGETITGCLNQLSFYANRNSTNLSVFILEEGGDQAYSNAVTKLKDFVNSKDNFEEIYDNAYLLKGSKLLDESDIIERNLFISVFHTPKG